MGVHFISVLGTSLYEPVVYHFSGQDTTPQEQEFVQIALLKRFKEQILQGGKVSVLLTEGAKKRNWEDRAYQEKDVELSRRWDSAKKNEVQAGKQKEGMRSLLQKTEPQLYEKINVVPINNASTEEEIWSVFETLYNVFGEGDEIIFDITHSFRSIPMLAITIMNYAKVLKNCKLKGIYYGAYEAAQITDGVKYAPIVDLTVYDEILEWTNAAEAFMRYGFSNKMQEVYAEKMERFRKENGLEVFIKQKNQWAPIKKKIDAMKNLEECIFTGRGTDAKELQTGTYENKSLKNAYEQLADISRNEKKEAEKEIKPLYPLLEKIETQYGQYFNREKNYEIGCGAVEWSIHNNMVQQGYTALEETIKTYLCDKYGIDDKEEETRDGIIGGILTGTSKYLRENDIRRKEFEELRLNQPERVCQEVRSRMYTQALESEYSDQINTIILSIPLKMVELSLKVKEKRNDINHFGFRANPAPAQKFGSQLEQCYKEFKELIKG